MHQPEGCMSDSKKPAHILYVELATRITTQRLHYRSGDEETAAASIYSLFSLTRKLMYEHADAEEFHKVALYLLNTALRSYAARWHGWMTKDGDKSDKEGKPILKFRDEWVRRKFREELQELRPEMLTIQEILYDLSCGKPLNEGKLKPKEALPKSCLGDEVQLKIRPEVTLYGADLGGKNLKNKVSKRIAILESHFIAARREAISGKAVKPREIVNTTGLALSGGGIRSATFCLGIVQELYRWGIFNQVDYLSTVSGGGYLGTFLSSYLGSELKSNESPVPGPTSTVPKTPQTGTTPTAKRVDEAFGGREQGLPESPALRHLRNNSKYLLNGGGWAFFRVGIVMVTGFVTSLLMLLMVPLMMAWITRLLKFPGEKTTWVHVSGTGASWFFQQPYSTVVLGLAGIWLLLYLTTPLFHWLAKGRPWESRQAWALRVFELTSSAVSLLALLAAGLCLSFPMVEFYETFGQRATEFLKGLSLPEIPDWLTGILAGVVPLILGWLSRRNDGSARRWAEMLFFLTGPLFFLLTFLIFASHLGVGEKHMTRDAWLGWGIVTAILLARAFFFQNINTFAPHRYYRDRLCECYLAVPGKPQQTLLERGVRCLLQGSTPDSGQQTVGAVKSMPLTKLGASKAAPYHLINAVLNAEASPNPELRGRNGDFFLFSRHYCGSALTGYVKTEDVEKQEPGLDVGTAMAISGAAASSNMGWKTLRSFRFLMTLFNVRLGYWMHRPGSKPYGGPGPLYFLKEMVGHVNERSKFVNLSDGGHIENLAVYELLRRQCKFIVCVDAGMEPGMECSDLMRLQMYASIDFGIQMHFDPSDLTLLPTSYSRAYAILVKIDYAPSTAKEGRETSDKLGWMLYLKLAVTGMEPRYVLDYRRQNPAFPHQSTGDQLYDEAQFESYRALGECAAKSLFRTEIIEALKPAEITVEKWFESLANCLLADNDEVFKRD